MLTFGTKCGVHFSVWYIRWLNFSFHLQVVAIMRAGKVRVGLFPHLEETVECQHDTLKPLPGTAPRPWKKGKKSAFKVRQNF